jgi:hypothetical protein
MEKYFTSLYDYKVRKHALIFALVNFLADKLIYLSGESYLNSGFHHILFNYLVCLGLLIAVNCKDKMDDERSMIIRYSIFKNTFSYIIILFGVIALFMGNAENSQVSVMTILYCLQGILLLHMIFIVLANKYNPSWLFKENTAPKNYNQMMIGFMYGFYFIMLVLVVVSLFIMK